MKTNRAYRYELKPSVAQRILLAKHAGCARFAYNWGLARRIALYQEEKKSAKKCLFPYGNGIVRLVAHTMIGMITLPKT